MKRTIEYTRTFRDTDVSEITWFNRMADDRWELVASDGPGTYIFRRPIQDRFMTALAQHIEAHENYEEQDDFEKGTIYGLRSAYSMYVNWGD